MLSKAIVAGKVKNGIRVIQLFSYNHPELDFETENTTFRKSFRIQAERLAAHIQNGIQYIPFEREI